MPRHQAAENPGIENTLKNGLSFPKFSSDGNFSHFPDSLPQCLTMLTVKMFFLLSHRAAQMPTNSLFSL